MTALLAVLRALKPRSSSQQPLDPGAFHALHGVGCHGPVRPSDLAVRMQLDASTVSRHVRNLEQAGYVARQPDPADGRAFRIELSEAGRSVLNQMFDARRALLAAALTGWSEQDRDSLAALVQRLAEDISRTETEAEMK